MHRPSIKIGVMGSASTSISSEDLQRVDDLAQRLGKKLAAVSCVLITGELDGIPGRVVAAHRQNGGLSVGISPAHSAVEFEQVGGFIKISDRVAEDRDLANRGFAQSSRHNSAF